MKKVKKYKYIGRNGTIITSIVIDGAANKIDMLYLVADEGKILTNGELQLHSVLVYMDEVDLWSEIDIAGQE